MITYSYILWAALLGANPSPENPPGDAQSVIQAQEASLRQAQALPLPSKPDSMPQDQMVFTDFTRKNWVHLPVSPKNSIVCKHGGAMRKLSPPMAKPELGYYSAGRSHVWLVQTREAQDTVECVLYRCPCDPKAGTWERVATVDPSSGIPHLLVPLSDPTRFIGAAMILGFAKPEAKTASCLGIFRMRNDVLEYERDLELPFGDREHIGQRAEHLTPAEHLPPDTPQGSTRLSYCAISPRGLTPSLWLPSLSKDYLAVTAAQAGVIWIYSLDTGRLKRMINLCGLDEKSIPKTERLKWIIMGTAFAPDGRLIVASRPPDMVEVAVKLDDSKMEPKERKQVFEAMAENYKDLQWWEIDPDEGTTRRIENPIDYPAGTKSFTRQAYTRFLVDENGKVRSTASSSWDALLKDSGATAPADSVKKAGMGNQKGGVKTGTKDAAREAATDPTSTPSVPSAATQPGAKPGMAVPLPLETTSQTASQPTRPATRKDSPEK